MPDIDIRLQYHSPDRAFVAIFLRDGEEWYLEGVLVGMASSPAGAVAELLATAQELVIKGELPLGDQLSLADRLWLFKHLDIPDLADWDTAQEMYAAIRVANGGVDPYRLRPGSPPMRKS
jgi:hypothetical protein